MVSPAGGLNASAGLVGPVAADAEQSRGSRHLLRRVVAVGIGVAVFGLVASVVDPRPSPGADPVGTPVLPVTPGGSKSDQGSAASRDKVQRGLLARPHPSGWPALGLIEGLDYYVLIHGSPEGPRYTVCSLGGRILQADLPADEVYRAFPTVDIEGMRLEPAVLPVAPMPDGPALMLAEPRE